MKHARSPRRLSVSDTRAVDPDRIPKDQCRLGSGGCGRSRRGGRSVCKGTGRHIRRSDRAIRDYSRRSDFPKPPEAMRGAARSFQVPKDMRTPEPMRAFTSQTASDRPVVEHWRA